MPVPKDMVDEAFYKQLEDLDMQNAKLFLRVVHAHDEDGTGEGSMLRRLIVQRQSELPQSVVWGGHHPKN